jgi:hypothetical protein
MHKLIKDFVQAQKNLIQYFECPEDFPAKVFSETWYIYQDDDAFFLNYFKDNKKFIYMIVNKNNQPMIYKKQFHTMIVVIDCIKIAYIFENILENSSNQGRDNDKKRIG